MKFQSLLSIAAVLASASAKKIFIDNDGLAPLQLLFPIAAGHEVLGLSTSFGSASLVDGAGQAYDILNTYNLSSCVPHYIGAQQPLLRTYETFHAWEDLFGALVWQGAYDPHYKDSYSWENITYNDTLAGAIALIDAVKSNKDTDPVIVYAAGMMTTVAQALSIYPDLAKDAQGLYIMGGYFDNQYAQTIGDSITIDINTDINLIQDPEAAQIVLTADWDEIVIGGNVTNYLVPSQKLYDILEEKAGGLDVIRSNPYFAQVSKLLATGNYSQNNDQETLPFWDEVVSAYMSWPELILETTNASVAVDTSFYSPFYGSLRMWNPEWAPKSGYKIANATIIDKIDDEKFYGLLIDTFFKNWTQYCEVDGAVPLIL
ncbi:hypothetical protein WICANDRAFT_87743 [Wickerhamomyces anomalus NRRL Y-366-8]|uniref:Inosine/uridine-preferring nucleoside hydrolase domain-containing protein n=1 Tax=Wickerhamomyces anomalus (strain ATCC 58044 / CBS 1984 / NCYC 433 / NRRL Y-366-8) TaxID=683960 RepID=A0A1E3PAA6_WICAA|nr:uncharacterized protein WICANDRAFT_87743 [Wickerhamomyces anomalus NRRL Y-366-8]ODQ62349.1 hypothetical protein WICANDRAFT_87743 [Wickerhamomyces anomalus NRRL Y-366-8]